MDLLCLNFVNEYFLFLFCYHGSELFYFSIVKILGICHKVKEMFFLSENIYINLLKYFNA